MRAASSVMPGFRGSDAKLEAELATLDQVIQLRLRRYARELADLERDRRALALERARRKAEGRVPAPTSADAASTV